MDTKRDHSISLANVQAIIDRVVPGAAVRTADPISGGRVSRLYAVTFVDPARPNLILKIYGGTHGWKMQTEVMVLNALRGGRLPVPIVIAGDCSRTLVDRDVAVMTALPGRNARQGEANATLPALRSIYAQIGRSLRNLHTRRTRTFGFIGPEGTWTRFDRNSAFMVALFEAQLEHFASLGGDATVGERVRRRFEACRPFLDEAAPVLCHFDLNLHNVLVTDGGDGPVLTGIVDFEGAVAGDPLLDVAKSLCETKANCRPVILAGYGPVERPGYKTLLYAYFLLSSMTLCCWKMRNGFDITQESDDLSGVPAGDRPAAWLL